MLWLALHFPAIAPATLERIAAWACQFTPKVSLELPNDVLLEVEGSLRMLGGRERLEERLGQGLAAMELPAQLAFSPVARAALWRARGGGSPLEELPLSVMQMEPEVSAFLRGIGISRLGELLRLPREGLARRCGQQLLDDLDRALGAMPEPRKFFAPPALFAARLELPAEVTHAERALFAARRLLVQLEGLLAARQAGVRSFTLSLFHRRAQPTRLEISLASPAREAARLGELLRERFAAQALLHPVEAIGLEAGNFSPLEEKSRGLFGDVHAQAEEWARLVERLQARLGAGAVHGLRMHADHRPERACVPAAPQLAVHGKDKEKLQASGPRPMWLLEPPRRLGEEGFELLVGPERIESGWWDGEEVKRDYFIARIGEASVAWVYREAGEWFLHGLFA